ncbi:MAG: hypothetical protein ACRDYZ_00685 [Acidimicrobiales bacterium]
MVFLVLVILQNVLKVATNTSDTASAAQILRFAHDQAWSVHLLVVTYVIGFPALFLFAGGLTRRCEQLARASDAWGRLGRSSVVVIAVLFGLINVLQIVLVAARGDLAGDPALVRTLWTLHNAVFTLNLLAVGGALLGLGRAAALSGLVPRWLGRLSVAGAALLAIAAAPAVAEVHGSKLLAVGLVGFVCWLTLLAVSSARLLREGSEAPAQPGRAVND